MAQISLEQAKKLNEGGGKFFKIGADESKQVRFLWDKWEEVNGWCYGVHEIMETLPDGRQLYKSVDCPRADGSQVECKYCASRTSRVGRVVIPLYLIDEDKIQYWKRSDKWVDGTLKPVLDEIAHLPSIANQTFKIKRTGSGFNDTSYSIVPVMNASDNRTKMDFGDLDNPYDLGLIINYGEENNKSSQQTQQTQQFNQPSTAFQPRRTTEMF